MTLSIINSEIETSIGAIDLLRTMGGDGGPVAAQGYMNTWLNGVTAFEYIKEDAVSPAAVAAVAAGVGVLCVHGTDLPAQYVPQITGWFNGLLGQGGSTVDFPRNPWIRAAGERARLLADRVGVWRQRSIFVFGHSAGHGISSEALATTIALNLIGAQNLNITNISFGGNGFANRATLASYSAAGVSCIRWMTAQDPVPLFPWCATQMLGGSTFLAPDTLQAILNVQHLNGGRDLPTTGAWTDRTLPSAASVTPGQSVVGWLRTIESGDPNPHWTSEYKSRLQALPVPAQPDYPPGRTHSRGEPATATEPPLQIAIPSTQAEAARQLNQMVADAREQAAAQPMAPPVILPGFAYVARKGNGTWGVEKGGIQVATPGDKRSARDLARKLNRLERDIEDLDDENLLETVAFLSS
jgi:hypothetical protein